MSRSALRFLQISLFLLIPVLLIVIVGAHGWSQPLSSPTGTVKGDARFDHPRAFVHELMDKYQIPSVSIAVAEHGKVVWEEAFGWGDRERLQASTPDTMYSLASISKPFTATGIMELVEQGKIKLDSPADEYLGRAKLSGLGGDASGATIRRVLSHTSGLPLHWQFFYENEDYGPPTMDETILRYGILVNTPGSVYQYSNLGFGILSYITSRVSGVTYEDYMRTRVFAPLGLTHTSVGIEPELKSYVAPRYDSDLRPLPYYTFDHIGASALYSSAHDLVRFGMFHLKDHLLDQQPILTDATIDEMHQSVTPTNSPGDFYGLGFVIEPNDHGFLQVSHNGGMPGVSTVLALFPTEDIAIVVLTNTNAPEGRVRPIVTQVAEQIAAAMLPKYAQDLKAHPGESAPAVDHSYHFQPDLAGEWIGTVRTWQSSIPIKLVFQADNDIHVKLGDQFEALLAKAQRVDKSLTGWFAGRIPTPDAKRHIHGVRLELWLQNGKLVGEANAQADEVPEHHTLASYVELTKTKE